MKRLARFPTTRPVAIEIVIDYSIHMCIMDIAMELRIALRNIARRFDKLVAKGHGVVIKGTCEYVGRHCTHRRRPRHDIRVESCHEPRWTWELDLTHFIAMAPEKWLISLHVMLQVLEVGYEHDEPLAEWCASHGTLLS